MPPNSNDELVARYDAAGFMVGTALRSEVRAAGLWHAAAMVLVRSTDGTQAYVHLRTDDKDVFPGLHDCWAGGVIAAGETPAECAARELAEELGITSVTPRPLFTLRYEQPPQRSHNFVFEIHCDGPFTPQPAEIVSGAWMTMNALRRWAEAPGCTLTPDGRHTIQEWFRRYG